MNNHDFRLARRQTHRRLIDWFLCSLGVIFIVAASTTNTAAQTPTGRYVLTLPDGSKVYLNDEIKSLAGGNKTAWQKGINRDASANVSLSEWNCAKKTRRTLQITTYDENQALIETRRDRFEWTRIIPGSTGEFLHRLICQPAVPPQIAEISGEIAFLRAARCRCAGSPHVKAWRTIRGG